MLVALNGYSENDAMWGLGTYVVLAVILTAAMAAGAGVTTRALIGKQMSALVSSLIAISLFSIGGVIAGIVCSLIGVGVAEFVRVMF